MPALPKHDEWKSINLARLNEQLAPLRAQGKFEKIIQGDLQGIFLHKQEDILAMYCYDNDTHQLSNIMSRIDLANPLNLVGPYSQAVFLSAFWQSITPKSVYIAGFGGGRLAMLYHHYFPHMRIDGTDIDPNVISVAHDYFGLDATTLAGVKAKDSRKDLDERNTRYDIIFLDVFIGGGQHVNHLATSEFFALCKKKLSENGVLTANLVETDPLMERKIAAMQSVFSHCLVWEYDGAHVVFAGNCDVSIHDIKARTNSFQNENKPDFDLSNKATMLKVLKKQDKTPPLADIDLK